MKCLRILPGDMCKHIALPGKIDPKHRARQYLSYRAFRYDLSFLRHRANYTLERRVAQLADSYRDVVRQPECDARRYFALTQLIREIVGRYSRSSWRFHQAPVCRCSLTVCKTIAIKHRADVARRFIRKRILRKQSGDVS